MKNKILVEVKVPEIDETYSVFLPINKKMGNIIILLNKAISEMSGGNLKLSNFNTLYNAATGKEYQVDVILSETDIRTGTKLVLLS
jgi:hypothetical protein